MKKTQNIESLSQLRDEIEVLDLKLIDLLKNRMKISRTIGRIKKENRVEPIQPSRKEYLFNQWKSQNQLTSNTQLHPLSDLFLSQLFELIHSESVRIQRSVD